MTRREIIIRAGQAFPILAGALYLIDCGGSSTSPGPNPTPTPQNLVAVSTTEAGHNHSATIPLADLGTAGPRSYPSSSSAGHVHTVTLTTAQLATLAGGGAVTVTSTVDQGHSHDFTFRR